jgi:hypothetical protein
MQYILLIYGDEKAWESRSREEQGKMFEEHGKYAARLRDEGRMVHAAPLESSGRAVTVRNGSRTDGPFAETKEQLGGYYVIEADSVDQAADWAKQIPGDPTVEVRPLVAM